MVAIWVEKQIGEEGEISQVLYISY